MRRRPSAPPKGVLPRTQPCWPHDLRLLDSRTGRNTFLLLSYPVYGLFSQPKLPKIYVHLSEFTSQSPSRPPSPLPSAQGHFITTSLPLNLNLRPPRPRAFYQSTQATTPQLCPSVPALKPTSSSYLPKAPSPACIPAYCSCSYGLSNTS